MPYRASSWIVAGALVTACVGTPALAQENRSAWMWSKSSHPYGADNILGDVLKEAALIRDFEFWGFDRIYTSLGALSATDPSALAHWNAGLDDAGVQSQMLLGEPTWLYPSNRPGLINIVQTRLINFNASRTDPREWIDGLHLDIEPHQLSAWGSGTNADRRDLLLNLGDTYADVRALLDNNGQSQVKIYADLPVWFDSSSNIGWAPGERDAWFADIGGSLEGISMMAYERGTLSHINNGVQWEIDNFNGEVRIGLESNSNGPGKTWPTFQDMLNMADALDAYHGSTIGGIDYHPLADFADLAEHAPPIVYIVGDLDGDGFVGINDLNVILGNWNQAVEVGNVSQGDIAGTGDGFIGISDLNVLLGNWNSGSPPATGVVVPEPGTYLLLGLLGTLIPNRRAKRA